MYILIALSFAEYFEKHRVAGKIALRRTLYQPIKKANPKASLGSEVRLPFPESAISILFFSSHFNYSTTLQNGAII